MINDSKEDQLCPTASYGSAVFQLPCTSLCTLGWFQTHHSPRLGERRQASSGTGDFCLPPLPLPQPRPCSFILIPEPLNPTGSGCCSDPHTQRLLCPQPTPQDRGMGRTRQQDKPQRIPNPANSRAKPEPPSCFPLHAIPLPHKKQVGQPRNPGCSPRKLHKPAGRAGQSCPARHTLLLLRLWGCIFPPAPGLLQQKRDGDGQQEPGRNCQALFLALQLTAQRAGAQHTSAVHLRSSQQ